MEKLNVHVENGVQELKVLTGEAPFQRVINPEEIVIAGEIQALRIYAEKRLDDADYKSALVLLRRDAMTAELSWNLGTDLTHKVTGILRPNPDLAAFGINENKTFTLTDLAGLLKRSRYFFADPDRCAAIVSVLKNFKGKVQRDIEASNDDKGNKRALVHQQFTGELDQKFTLEMPVFVGFFSSSFEVEICFDVRDSGVSVWLESEELHRLKVQSRDERLDAIKEFFKDKCPVIEQ